MIDLLYGQPHYRAHLQPVWDALPDESRGRVLTAPASSAGGSVLVAGFTDLIHAQATGYRHIAYLEHGIGQSYGNGHPAYPGGRQRDAVGLFLSPNETAAAADRAAYPSARVEVVGDPVLDTLPVQVDDGAVVAISFHWGSDITRERRSTLPHYRGVLPDLARSFDLIGHGHPRIARLLSRVYGKLGIEWVPDFEEVCRRAAVYACDNSSTLYEFASTGRPVVVMNGPAMRRDRELGLRFWKAATVGIQVDQPDELVDAIGRALADPPEQRAAREAALGVAYAHRSGAGPRAAAAIVDWLRQLQAIAA